MEAFWHRFSDLFDQLGLPSDVESIKTFIDTHSPLPDSVRLEEATCWIPGQAQMLKEELMKDADWAEVIDRLSLALRRSS